MLLYVFALLLVYTDGRGIGNPDDNSTILGNALLELANHCGNQLLIDESRKVARECNLIVPPYEEKQLKCLMFYDINNQLCHAKPPIPVADYKAKMNEKTNITSFCGEAAKWSVQNIAEYPEYRTKLDIIFKDLFECYKICSEEDLLSKDMNFYCKYFKWGTELLNAHKTNENEETAGNAPSGVDFVKLPTNTANSVPVPQTVVAATNGADTKKPIEVLESKDNQVDSVVQASSSALNAPGLKSEDQAPSKNPVVTSEDLKPDQKPDVKMEPMPSSNIDVPKVPDNEEKPPVKMDEIKEDPDKTKSKVPDSDPDYESEFDEEGKEGLPDHMEDGDDAEGEIKPYPSNDKPAKKAEVAVSILNPEDSERSVFPNMQEGFTDEEDNFFPFFLTVVILVVLLYVLYHNKSKVTKVVLGLIVEGRQSGRGRRGSRNHAYRRLDTLEQAMGAPSTAAPSKIIY